MRTFSRLIVTSILLVTMAAFVVQGATSAGGHSHARQASTVAAMAHAHGTGAEHSHDHDHDHGVVDQASLDQISAVEDDHGFAQAESCCGTFCSAVLCVVAPELESASMRAIVPISRQSQAPGGIGPEGLKRPPRTIGMA